MLCGRMRAPLWRVVVRRWSVRRCSGGVFDGVGAAAESAEMAQLALDDAERRAGESLPENADAATQLSAEQEAAIERIGELKEEYHVTMLRLLRRLIRSNVLVVVHEEGSQHIAGFPEANDVSYSFAFSTAEAHKQLLDSCPPSERELVQGLAAVKDMPGAELIMRLVALSVQQEDMQKQHDTDVAGKDDQSEAERKVGEVLSKGVGGFRINGFPVPLECPHVEAVLRSFRTEQQLRAARGDPPPKNLGPELQMLGAGEGADAIKSLSQTKFYLPSVKEADTGKHCPVTQPFAGDQVRGSAMLVFTDKLSAWLYVHRGLKKDEPDANVALPSVTGERLWELCATTCGEDGFPCRGIVLNALPHTEPLEGEPTPLILLRSEMNWIEAAPASAA